MLSLVQIQNDQLVVSSRQVAEHFKKNHRDLLRDIRLLISTIQVIHSSADFCAYANVSNFFFESTYDDRGVKKPEFLMNRDGFTLLAMGFTGLRALKWKMAYISAFNSMEAELKKQRDSQYEAELVFKAIEFAEKLSEKIFWITKSEIVSKRLAIEFTARQFNMNLDLFAEILPKSNEDVDLTATQIGAILGITATEINQILRKMKYQRRFRKIWIPIGDGLNYIGTNRKWKTSVIEIIKTFLAERLDE